MTDYTTWPVIGKGTERTCYLNPADKTHLVKISPRTNAKQTLREISYFGYLKRKGVPFDHLPRFYGKIEGEGFIGIEQELIRDTVPSGKSADMFTPPAQFTDCVKSDHRPVSLETPFLPGNTGIHGSARRTEILPAPVQHHPLRSFSG